MLKVALAGPVGDDDGTKTSIDSSIKSSMDGDK